MASVLLRKVTDLRRSGRGLLVFLPGQTTRTPSARTLGIHKERDIETESVPVTLRVIGHRKSLPVIGINM